MNRVCGAHKVGGHFHKALSGSKKGRTFKTRRWVEEHSKSECCLCKLIVLKVGKVLDTLSNVRVQSLVTLGDARAEGRSHSHDAGSQGACPEAATPAVLGARTSPGSPEGKVPLPGLRGLAAACRASELG